jgi:hypothetical protein
MANHIYWRLNFTENNGDTSFLGLAEVEMRGTVGGADQCTGGTATASTSDATSPPANAFDNSASTNWQTVSGTLTGWLRYQFAAAVDVVQYTITARATSLTRMPKSWSLEWSDNGTAWTSIETRENQTWPTAGEVRTFTVPTGTMKVRNSQVAVEVVRRNLNPAIRTSQVVAEVIRLKTDTRIRNSQIVVEVLRPNAAEISAVRPHVFVCT